MTCGGGRNHLCTILTHLNIIAKQFIYAIRWPYIYWFFGANHQFHRCAHPKTKQTYKSHPRLHSTETAWIWDRPWGMFANIGIAIHQIYQVQYIIPCWNRCAVRMTLLQIVYTIYLRDNIGIAQCVPPQKWPRSVSWVTRSSSLIGHTSSIMLE